MVSGQWEPPLYQTVRKLPFSPKETEIDQLIAGCSKRIATLQTLKGTGARCGEIGWLKWEEIDFESSSQHRTRKEQQPTCSSFEQ
jgi:integrase